jgi:hypothetical protein
MLLRRGPVEMRCIASVSRDLIRMLFNSSENASTFILRLAGKSARGAHSS